MLYFRSNEFFFTRERGVVSGKISDNFKNETLNVNNSINFQVLNKKYASFKIKNKN